MRPLRSILFSTAAIALASPVTAGPNETAVLVEYFGMLDDSGMTFEVGTMDETGRQTQWNDIKFGNEDIGFSATIPWIRVTGGLLGGQTITVAEKMTADIKGDPELDFPPMKLEITTVDYEVAVTGEPGARGYDATVGEMKFRTIGEGPLNLDGSIKGLVGTYFLGGEADARVKGTFGAETVVVAYDVDEEDVTVKATFTINDMSGDMDVPMALSADPVSFLENFDTGQSLLYDYKLGKMNSTMQVVLDDIVIQDLTTVVDSSTGRFSLADGTAQIVGTSDGISYEMGQSLMTGMPAMSAEIASMDMDMVVPLENMDAAKPAKIKLALSDLTLSNSVWAMFDATSHFSRDPMNLDIDLTGNVIWDTKIADINPEEMARSPILLENVTINALNLQAGGAELTTKGALTLNNDIFPPVPAGDVEVSIKGGMSMIDNLVLIGVIPQEQAMMAKGMSMMFFTAGGDGDDHLVSKLNMTADGHISANGMPLK